MTVCGEPGEESRPIRGTDQVVPWHGSSSGRSSTFAPPGEEGPNPQLVIGGDVVARGPQTLRALEGAVRQSLSDW